MKKEKIDSVYGINELIGLGESKKAFPIDKEQYFFDFDSDSLSKNSLITSYVDPNGCNICFFSVLNSKICNC